MNTHETLESARYKMIEQQIRPWDVLDMDILDLLNVVKREDFVPAAHRSLAFVDMELPLPEGQTMFSPKMEARILQDLHVQPHETVLEIGAGSGYMAALLAARSQRVTSLEIFPELANLARANLRNSNVANVEVLLADGADVKDIQGTFDVIVLSGSLAEVPHALLAKLNIGGRLSCIVGNDPMMRASFVTRQSDTSFVTVQPWDTVAPRLVNFAEPSSFHF